MGMATHHSLSRWPRHEATCSKERVFFAACDVSCWLRFLRDRKRMDGNEHAHVFCILSWRNDDTLARRGGDSV